jgi:hypothetical protein
MEDATTPVISGIVVLVAGLLAFLVVVGGESEIAEPDVARTSSVGTSLSDLDPAVERVLLGTGNAWIYEADAGPGLPVELARVLDAYQAPLMVPAGEGQ